MKNLLFFVLIALCVASCKSRNDAQKEIEGLNKMAFDYRYKNVDSSRIMAKKVILLLDSAGNNLPPDFYNSQKAIAWNTLSFLHFLASNFDLAKLYMNNVRKMRGSYKSSEIEVAITYIIEARFKLRECKYGEAYNMYNDSITIFNDRFNLFYKPFRYINNALTVSRQDKERYNWAKSEYLIGNAALASCCRAGDLQDALSFLDKIKSNRDLLTDNTQQAAMYYAYAEAYTKALEPDKPHYLDSAFAYIEKGIDIMALPSKNINYYIARNYQLIAQILTDTTAQKLLQRNPAKIDIFKLYYLVKKLHWAPASVNTDSLALLLYQKADSLFEGYQEIYQLLVCKTLTGEYYLSHGDTLKAQTVFNDALKYNGVITDLGGAAPQWNRRIYSRLLTSATRNNSVESIKNWHENYLQNAKIVDENRRYDYKSQLQINRMSAEKANIGKTILAIVALIIIASCFLIPRYRKIVQHEKALKKANDIGFKIMASMSGINTVIPAVATQQLIETIRAEFHHLFNMDILTIGLFDREHNALKFPHTLKNEKELPYRECSLNETGGDSQQLAVLCFKNQQEIYVNNCLNDKECRRRYNIPRVAPLYPEAGVAVSVIYLPLINARDGRPMGVISIQSEKQLPFYYPLIPRPRFGSYQRLLFKTISTHVAIALDAMLQSVPVVEDLAISDTCNSIIRHDLSPVIKNYLPKCLDDLRSAIERRCPDVMPDVDTTIEVFHRLRRVFDTIPVRSKLIANKLPFNASVFAIQDVFDSLKEYNNSLLTFSQSHLNVRADRVLIEILLRNLIQNAKNATAGKQGATIRISAEKQGKEYVKIAVADTGVGIPEKQIEGLFNMENDDATRERQDKKHGFGLLLCRYIMQEHSNNTIEGCKIWAESVENEGSTFAFTLEKM